MSRLRPVVSASVAAGAALIGGVAFWRRHPRLGTTFVNSRVNPILLGSGLAGRKGSEFGTLEHVGRRSGIHRFTPVHPEATDDGFRILVPLGENSEWARNVLAAGTCRLRVHDVTYELDRPEFVPAAKVDDVPAIIRRAMTALGFEYLELRASSTPA
jgi:deazaflavin-dependent oxidoreductase (nitroreductase family)